ncbi:MAG: HD domain-containing protein [Erysipelotrichaceae bacterium]|nr:HD domain-containing protein [Erysipelotrichaceae bacterium]
MSKEELASLLNDEKVLKMKDFVQHGNISTYEHCLSVTNTALHLAGKLKMKVDEDVLVKAGMLHDYYLYDWHNASIRKPLFKMHGYTHPDIACENAKRDFKIDDKVGAAIKSHMWPLTLRSVPSSKEAWLICLADKVCALKETVKR